MPFDFFSKKKLADAANYNPSAPAQPQGNQDAGLDIAKMAQDMANQKLGAPSPTVAQQVIQPGTAPFPLTPKKFKK